MPSSPSTPDVLAREGVPPAQRRRAMAAILAEIGLAVVDTTIASLARIGHLVGRVSRSELLVDAAVGHNALPYQERHAGRESVSLLERP